MGLYLSGVTHVDAPEILSSQKLEQLLGPVYKKLKLSEGRIEMQTGIKSRGMWPVGTLPSELSSLAARRLFEEKQIGPDEIDCVIHASVCRDVLEPATATTIHKNLGLSSHCMAFDLSNACLGVLSAVITAMGMIKSKLARKVLVVSGENSSPLILKTVEHLNLLAEKGELTRKSLRPYFANFTIGSAATAWLISDDPQEACAEIEGYVQQVDSQANHLCQGGGDTQALTMQTDSPALLEAGIQLSKKTFKLYREKFSSPINRMIGHQVGKAHNQGLRMALGLDGIEETLSYPEWGNTGSAALPLTLGLAHKQGHLRSGDHVALMGIGSGLSCLMMGLKWIK